MKKKKITKLRDGDVIDVEEFHDGRYGGPGKKRQKKSKPTEERVRQNNRLVKARKCRQLLIQYFSSGDLFITLTYRIPERPPDMKAAAKDFGEFMRRVRTEYKKQEKELYWIRNIEKGTKGGWHIHLTINEIGETASIVQKAWKKGGIYSEAIKGSKFYDEDFTKLADYMTKDEYATGQKQDGTPAKPRIKESSYSHSRNMPLPEPKVKHFVRWLTEPKPKKGYYIARIHEGINPMTGFKYRRYTMIRLNRRI